MLAWKAQAEASAQALNQERVANEQRVIAMAEQLQANMESGINVEIHRRLGNAAGALAASPNPNNV